MLQYTEGGEGRYVFSRPHALSPPPDMPAADPSPLPTERVDHCPICGSEEAERAYTGMRDRLYGAPGVWNLDRCAHCGSLWLNPRPTGEAFDAIYDAYYTQGDPPAPAAPGVGRWVLDAVRAAALGYGGSPLQRAAGVALSAVPLLRARATNSVMGLRADRRGRLLDLGAGDGVLMRRMDALGWDVVGLEPDPAAVEAARDRTGLDIRPGFIEDDAFPPGSFDAVTMLHVIEHVPDPVQTLRSCFRVLAPGGVLAVVTPNVESLGHERYGEHWRGLETPRHLVLFNAASLRLAAEAVGFEVEEATTRAGGSARFIYAASESVRRGDEMENGAPRSPSLPLKARALGFSLWENVARKARPVGEELFLLARKPER